MGWSYEEKGSGFGFWNVDANDYYHYLKTHLYYVFIPKLCKQIQNILAFIM